MELDIDRLEAITRGEYVAPPKDPFDIQTDDLFGGISGFNLPVEHYELLPGLTLSRTYAHLMAPFMMAFARPLKAGMPHPGPWASLREGGMTISVELRLDADRPPVGFDRLNTLWFVVALMRLRLALPLQMPVLSDRPFQEVPANAEVANLIPIELDIAHFRPSLATAAEHDLLWVRNNIIAAAELMREPAFNRALQTLDRVVRSPHSGAGIVIAWASIETLIRPGSRQITARVCRALAAYLFPPGSGRDRAYGKIAASYEARGGAAHAGALPESEQYQSAFQLAREAIMNAIEQRALPNVEDLLERWRLRT
jgi:hypothetical protein